MHNSILKNLLEEGADSILDVGMRGLHLNEGEIAFRDLLEKAVDKAYEQRQKELKRERLHAKHNSVLYYKEESEPSPMLGFDHTITIDSDPLQRDVSIDVRGDLEGEWLSKARFLVANNKAANPDFSLMNSYGAGPKGLRLELRKSNSPDNVHRSHKISSNPSLRLDRFVNKLKDFKVERLKHSGPREKFLGIRSEGIVLRNREMQTELFTRDKDIQCVIETKLVKSEELRLEGLNTVNALKGFLSQQADHQ